MINTHVYEKALIATVYELFGRLEVANEEIQRLGGYSVNLSLENLEDMVKDYIEMNSTALICC